jgi:ComF family protein
VNSLAQFLDGLVQLVFPNTCWACGQLMPAEAYLVCASCKAALLDDPHDTCPRCSSSIGPYTNVDDGCPACRPHTYGFEGALRLGPYQGCLREVILRMKQPRGEDLAEVMGALWARHSVARLRALQPDVLIPVPLHWHRHWQRGFNQSEVLAQALSDELHLPCRPRWLRRTRSTPKQTLQESPTARQDNVRGAFSARAGADVRDQTILLIDDVLTTGATASEAARALRPLRPRHIYIAVLAHGK